MEPNIEQTQININPEQVINKPQKSIKFIYALIVVVLVAGGFFFYTNFFKNKIQNQPLINNEQTNIKSTEYDSKVKFSEGEKIQFKNFALEYKGKEEEKSSLPDENITYINYLFSITNGEISQEVTLYTDSSIPQHKNITFEFLGEIYNIDISSSPNHDELVVSQLTTDGIISKPCVISITPADKTINALKKEIGEENFYIEADDSIFYMYEAENFLSSKNMKIISKKSEGTLKFKLINDKIAEVDLSQFYWGVLLFNGKEEPLKADYVDIEVDFEKYMKI